MGGTDGEISLLKAVFLGWCFSLFVSTAVGLETMSNFFFIPFEILFSTILAAATAIHATLGVFAWLFYAGISLGALGALLFPIYDLKRDYPRSTFDRDVPFHEEWQTSRTAAECINCGVETDGGYVIQFGRMDVIAGIVVDKDVEGRHYECAPCHEDPIEAALRAGREDPEQPEVESGDSNLTELVTCRMCGVSNPADESHCLQCDHPLPVAPTPGDADG